MNTCICCHNRLSKHLKRDRVYWFCHSCHQEMPNLGLIATPKIKSKKVNIMVDSVS